MPTPDLSSAMSFASPKGFGQWLRANHATETELWLKIYKKGSGIPSVTWNEVVTESLCWGWIDGIRKSLDDEAFLQRITPRKPRSDWSKRNTELVERLISEGRMEEAGLAHVRAAKADGRWKRAYSVSRPMVPADFLEALELLPSLWDFYKALPNSSRHAIAHGLASAKKPETRARRFKKFLDLLSRKEKP